MDEGTMTTSVVADQIGISERELQRLIRNGVVKAPKQAPGTVRRVWTEEDVDEARDAYVKHVRAQKKKRPKELP